MKFSASAILAVMAAVGVIAAPAEHLEKRQSTANGFKQGGCKKVIMVYARGSTEMGNVGTLGRGLLSGLKRAFNNDAALQGVDYPADIGSNMLPKGTSDRAIATMKKLIEDIAAKCPETRIAAGGYSQGSAVATGALSTLSKDVQDRVDAAVFFGYTKNRQNRGAVPNFPSDKLKVFCNAGDAVCTGTLMITFAHLTYGSKTDDAVNFIKSKVKA